MKVVVSKHTGFCSGVRQAVETALSVPAENTFVLGELIHNEAVVEKIAARGIGRVESVDEVPAGGRLIIRSHGAPASVFRECERRGIGIIDCTCPFVAKTQKIVEEKSRAGKYIVIAGDEAHPEVQGLLGRIEGEARVVASEKEDLSDLAGKEAVLVAQTTFSEKLFCKIRENLQKVGLKTLEIFPTICYTTTCRQREAEFLARTCDAVVVIGGRNSSNTKRLGELASAHGREVFFIHDADAFGYEKINFFDRVGVIAGASTPDWVTREVLFKMAENKAEVQETEITAPAEEVKAEAEETAAVTEETAAVATPAEETAPEAPAEEVEAKETAPVAEEVKAETPAGTNSAMDKVLAEIDREERYRKGQIIKVRIVSATDEGIFVSGSGKLENSIPKAELDCEEYDRKVYEEKAKTGEEIEVMVTAVRPTQLSQKLVKKLKEEEAMLEDIKAGKEFSVVCTDVNKGGLTAELGTYLVFVPRREIRMGYVADLEKYKGKTLRLKLIEIRNERRKEIIASQRVVLEAERAEREAAKAAKEENFFSSIQVGDVVDGKVERVTSFGAFVSVNGFDCLAHISDLSWTGIKSVTDVLEIGKHYEFKVLKIDRDSKKVSIGYKQLQPQPWDLAAEKYAVGDVIHGKVVRIVPFGAFVEIEKGIDGLVHVSQISHEWLENPTSVLTIGEEVDAQILAFSPAEHKITLSIKALQPRPEFEPRPEREENRPVKVKKGGRRNAASPDEEEEYREWKEGTSFGASISELLGSDEENK